MTTPSPERAPTEPSTEALEVAREAYRQGKYHNDVIGEFALALDRFREERELRALDDASYLVVKEADDGSWLNEPEMFDTRAEAIKYLRKIRGRGLSALAEVALYECRELIVPEDDCS